MVSRGYKKYMKKEQRQSSGSFMKIFIVSFFGMLLFFSIIIKSVMPNVDTSIGDYKEQPVQNEEEISKKIVDNRLEMIQNEDQGRTFTELMTKAEDEQKIETKTVEKNDIVADNSSSAPTPSNENQVPPADVTYKVFIGSYTSAEQAKVAKDIIQESGTGYNPIVKCLGSNNYTLQVGTFKNKKSAEALLGTILQNHLPGRIAQ